MLVRLSIRDIVLIDALDLEFAPGLTTLTGETGAGKSILLDAFVLALGGRGDASLVRAGCEQGQVTAAFDTPANHPAHLAAREFGLASEDELVLRRVQAADGRTRRRTTSRRPRRRCARSGRTRGDIVSTTNARWSIRMRIARSSTWRP
jgi:DNA repair protein RecN (Recombination protein N)